MRATLLIFALGLTLVACEEDPDNTNAGSDTSTTADTGTDLAPDVPSGCTSNAECNGGSTPYCNLETGACEPLPAGHPIGWGDGTPSSVTLTTIFTPPASREAVDLEFDPLRSDVLWVLYRERESNEPCTSTQQTFAGCTSLEGSVFILNAPGTPEMTSTFKKDWNAIHFMRRPPAMAFGAADTFATCGEYITGNFEDEEGEFIGPTLWSSDPEIFARTPLSPAENGSHLDMLHASPLCVGIAHETANIYWVFNGKEGSLDRYDFKDDHGPGNEDHSDGTIFRYAAGTLSRVPGVPGHMEYYPIDSHIYVADTGNGRVVKLNTVSGEVGEEALWPVYEDLADSGVMTGAEVSDVVPAGGPLQNPAGLAIHEDILYISDNATSQIHAFDMKGNLLRSLDTGMPAGSLGGLTFGPTDGKMYFTSIATGVVFRIDPEG